MLCNESNILMSFTILSFDRTQSEAGMALEFRVGSKRIPKYC